MCVYERARVFLKKQTSLLIFEGDNNNTVETVANLIKEGVTEVEHGINTYNVVDPSFMH